MTPAHVTILHPYGIHQTCVISDKTIVGRIRKCDLIIDDRKASREHCIIYYGPTGWELEDLDSRNGTYVNAIPVKKRALRSGDCIQIGLTQLIFQLDDNDQPRPGAKITSDGSAEDLHVTQMFSTDEILFSAATPQGGNKNSSGMLSILYEMGKISAAGHDPEDVLRDGLNILLDLPDSGRASGLVFENKEITLNMVRQKNEQGRLHLSRKMIEHVLEKNTAVTGEGREGDEGYESISVPLESGGQNLGLLYMDTLGSGYSRFEITTPVLITAVGRILGTVLLNAIQFQSISREKEDLIRQKDPEYRMVGKSAKMKKIFSLIQEVASADATVLITGESGTGKELVARAVHSNSPRNSHPMVVVNCGAIPSTLMESELFGHEKGAFTGASFTHQGCFERAHNSSIFLDEISELPPDMQVKLLRVIENKQFTRVGGTREIKTDTRIIAASNRDLHQAMQQGLFRKDLYFRFRVMEINLPPLRERKEDIPVLAEYFIEKITAEHGRKPIPIEQNAMKRLETYSWQGNIRELRNAIERAIVLCEGDVLTSADFNFIDSADMKNGSDIDESGLTLKEMESQHIRKILALTAGNKTRAAELLGVERKTLYNKIRALGIHAEGNNTGLSG